MHSEEIIALIIREGKSLTKSEKQKASGDTDNAYISDRVKYHRKTARLARTTTLLLYITSLLGTVLFWLDIPDSMTKWWLRGLLLVLAAFCLMGISALRKNHGRNASLLRIIGKIRAQEEEENKNS